MELPSILDWKTDSSDIAKTMHDALMTQTAKVKEMVAKLQPGDYTAWDLIIFAYIQMIPGILNANVHAQARSADLLTEIAKMNVRLEWLTKVVIGLTIVLVVLTVALLVVTVRTAH